MTGDILVARKLFEILCPPRILIKILRYEINFESASIKKGGDSDRIGLVLVGYFVSHNKFIEIGEKDSSYQEEHGFEQKCKCSVHLHCAESIFSKQIRSSVSGTAENLDWINDVEGTAKLVSSDGSWESGAWFIGHLKCAVFIGRDRISQIAQILSSDKPCETRVYITFFTTSDSSEYSMLYRNEQPNYRWDGNGALMIKSAEVVICRDLRTRDKIDLREERQRVHPISADESISRLSRDTSFNLVGLLNIPFSINSMVLYN